MMRRFDFLDDLGRIRCPTLAVAPGGDPIHTLDHYRALPEKIPDCEFVVYEGLPHNITDAAPDRCAADYRRFLLKHGQQAR
jgi:pimeloyl-ACP methyl ester carboxylesterase